MLEVAGIWEIGRSVPLLEADMWKCALKSYGIHELNMTPITGIHAPWINEFASIAEVIATYPDHTPVFVDEKAPVELADFEHPKDVLYIFGRSCYSPFSDMAKDHLSLRIDCPKMGYLWPHQCLPLIMRDRYMK